MLCLLDGTQRYTANLCLLYSAFQGHGDNVGMTVPLRSPCTLPWSPWVPMKRCMCAWKGVCMYLCARLRLFHGRWLESLTPESRFCPGLRSQAMPHGIGHGSQKKQTSHPSSILQAFQKPFLHDIPLASITGGQGARRGRLIRATAPTPMARLATLLQVINTDGVGNISPFVLPK